MMLMIFTGLAGLAMAWFSTLLSAFGVQYWFIIFNLLTYSFLPIRYFLAEIGWSGISKRRERLLLNS